MESRLRCASCSAGSDGERAGRPVRRLRARRPVDLLVEGVGVEFDGREAHLDRAAFVRERRRQARLLEAGVELAGSPPPTSTDGRPRTSARRCCGPCSGPLAAAVRAGRGPDTLRPPRLRPLPTPCRHAVGPPDPVERHRIVARHGVSRTICGRSSRDGECGRGAGGREGMGAEAEPGAATPRAEGDLDVAPGGAAVGADLVGLLHQAPAVLGASAPASAPPGSPSGRTSAVEADPDLARSSPRPRRRPALLGDPVEGVEEARGVPRGEQLLGVGLGPVPGPPSSLG